MSLAITYFPSLREAKGTRKATTWAALCKWLSTPKVELYKHDVPGFSIATFVNDRRALVNVEKVYAVGLDFDEDCSLAELRQRFADSAAVVHTTHSSTLNDPRARVFLLLSRPVTGDEYRRVYQAVASVVERGGLVVDRAASDPSRFWFRPSVPTEVSPFVHWVCDGRPVNVDGALARVPDTTPPPSVPPPSGPVGDVEARAAAYIERVGPAISGSGGRTTTFVLAQKLVRGFALDEATAYRLMAKWNETCQPPWSERELRAKIREAATAGRHAVGDMLERRSR